MSIQGYAEGIKYGVIDDSSSAVEIIIDESKRLTAIVEDLLYLSKLDSFQETIKPESLIAEDLLKSCIERINGIALHNKIKINTNFSDKKLIILADEEKLTRAIINILGNCLRYAKTEVNLSLNKDNSNLIITIEDDGAGFNENELGRIFDRFFKGTNGKYGLGLTITKSIIEMHNGTIVAKNSPKGGACFIIILTINE
jgi:signal transduction histidine kinase